jgi:hypothetical protein
MCYNIDSATFEWLPIQEVFVYDYTETAYRITSEQTDQLVTRNHRCIVDRGRGWEFVVAEEAARQHEIQVPIVENLCGLFSAIPSVQSLSGSEKQNLFNGMSEQSFIKSENREEIKTTGGLCGQNNYLPSMREDGMEAERIVTEGVNSNLFKKMQREVAGRRVEEACSQGTGGMDRGKQEQLCGKNDGGKQSGVEGRGNVFSQARELSTDQICSMPQSFFADGSEGWICNGASLAGCADNGEMSPAHRSCSSYQSQPPGQSVGEPATVCEQSGSQAIRSKGRPSPSLARIEPTAIG